MNKGIKILVADDDEYIPALLIQLLAKIGLTNVDVAHNGTEAINCLSEENYDLVITDIEMPGHNGFTVLTTTRQLYPEAKVIMMSGRIGSDPEMDARVSEAQPDASLSKPGGMASLQETVRRVLKA